jgi:pimeloyl-ACP methyl ester carboxylesterase
MVKKNLLPLLLVFILASCTNSNNKSMPAETPANLKSDSPGGYAPVNGLKMYYEIHGEGAPLVLIHGGGSTIQTTFGNILPLLARHHKVIAVELQAHGHTADRDSPESFAQDADDVAALLAWLKINKADFMGFSNGGHTSMQIGISHPELVNKLILVSAFYKRDGTMKGFFEGLEKANLGNMPAPLKEAYLKINNDSTGLQRMFDRDRTRMLQFKDWKDEEIASIKAPTLIIAGDEDVVTTEHTVKMSRLIPNAALMILPEAHGSFIGEVCTARQGSQMPELTVAAIEEFLSK